MQIKHNKLRNTGLIYELLVKQVSHDLLTIQESPAIQILYKYFKPSTETGKELKLYNHLTHISEHVEDTVGTLLELSRKLDKKVLKSEKYALISEIKTNYDIQEFFSQKIPNYRTLSAFFCLTEIFNTNQYVDPEVVQRNRLTLLNELLKQNENIPTVSKDLTDFKTQDRSTQILAASKLLERFNKKYGDLLPDQKQLLNLIVLESSTTVEAFKKLYNKQLTEVHSYISSKLTKLTDDILVIKLTEILNNIKQADRTNISDSDVTKLLQYHTLVAELKKS